MTKAEVQKKANPMQKWIKKDDQIFSRSRNTFSEIRVATPDSNRIVHPEGKQLQKENEEDSCGKQGNVIQYKVEISTTAWLT